MTQTIAPEPSARNRARLIAASGVTIILLSGGAALLPVLDRVGGTVAVGALLVVAGLVEIYAGTMRHETKMLAMLAGAVTTLAGLLFLINPLPDFFPKVTVVTGWLLVRSVILLVTAWRAHGSVRMWLGVSAAIDFLLGMVLLIGLSIATLVVTLFGATPTLVASFAWVLALSFVFTGLMLLEVASCEREPVGE